MDNWRCFLYVQNRFEGKRSCVSVTFSLGIIFTCHFNIAQSMIWICKCQVVPTYQHHICGLLIACVCACICVFRTVIFILFLFFRCMTFFYGSEYMTMSVLLFCRYPHVGKDHLVNLLKQLMVNSCHPHSLIGGASPNAADVPTLLGSNSFSLLACMYMMLVYAQVFSSFSVELFTKSLNILFC
jgi:hypothetical protein